MIILKEVNAATRLAFAIAGASVGILQGLLVAGLVSLPRPLKPHLATPLPALQASETDATCVIVSVGGSAGVEYLPTADSVAALVVPSAFDRVLSQQDAEPSRRTLYRTDSAERYTTADQPRAVAPPVRPQPIEQQLALIDLAPYKTTRARMGRMFSRKRKLEYKQLKQAYKGQQMQLFGGPPGTISGSQ